MSEVKNDKVMAGNLRNRVDVNLKLEIPKPDLSSVQNLHPATAPAGQFRKDQFGDQILKDLMTKWDHDTLSHLNHDDYFKKIPVTAASTGFKRKSCRHDQKTSQIFKLFFYRTVSHVYSAS